MSRNFLAKHHQVSEQNLMDKANVSGPVAGTINLTIGDPDMVTDQRIIRDAFEDVLAGHTGYTHPQGDPELRDAIRDFYRKAYGLNLDDSQVFVCTAGNVAMYLAMQVLLDKGDEVLIPTPCFGSYFDQVELSGGVPVAVPTREEEGFRVTTAALEAAVTPHTKALIFNTPCNPTGVCYGVKDLEVIADFAKRHDPFAAEVRRCVKEEEQAILTGKTAVCYTRRKLLSFQGDTKEEALLRSLKISEGVQGLVSGLSVSPAFLIAKGGITSSDIGKKALKVRRAEVMGQILPGIPVWKTGPESRFPEIPYVIFPGNVGSETDLRRAVEILEA